jgi:hypothetical protein
LDQGEATDKAAINNRSKKKGQIERFDYTYLSSNQREGLELTCGPRAIKKADR